LYLAVKTLLPDCKDQPADTVRGNIIVYCEKLMERINVLCGVMQTIECYIWWAYSSHWAGLYRRLSCSRIL